MAEDLLSAEGIPFPRALSATEMGSLLDFCHQISTSEEDVVVLDASELVMMDPLGLAMFRAVLEKRGGRRYHVNSMYQNLINYLLQMGFFDGLSVTGLVEQPGPLKNENCIKLQKVDAENCEKVASVLAEFVIGQAMGESEERSDYQHPVEYALKELLNNATSHARRNGFWGAGAWVACQYYPSNDSIRLAIVDNGCGFLATLENHEALIEPTHAGAIRTALLERVSCNRGPMLAYETDSQNQGVGLTTTARIAEKADGHLIVASGDAWLNTAKGEPDVTGEANWQGVAIAFSCCQKLLPQVRIGDLLPAVDDDLEVELSFS
ncbi:sensor histidine kinase [Pseudomonas sp. 165]|uniref:ATP-binding protein n=1 Tax=Pseudomonas sp. 165 TaxID=2746722 RepID=UPI002577A911|nr:ATP-binding protein [Pseudomonas sp. 165]MDM1713878.1 sensor histidine kinase [Pseudomonas sp. 165]